MSQNNKKSQVIYTYRHQYQVYGVSKYMFLTGKYYQIVNYRHSRKTSAYFVFGNGNSDEECLL